MSSGGWMGGEEEGDVDAMTMTGWVVKTEWFLGCVKPASGRGKLTQLANLTVNLLSQVYLSYSTTIRYINFLIFLRKKCCIQAE